MTNPFPSKGGTATKTAPAAKKAAAAPADDADEGAGTPLVPAGGAPKRDPFAEPSGGGGDYKFTEFVGELLLVAPDPESVGETMPTKINADTEILRVDVIRLDNDNERVDDLLIFQAALLRSFKKTAKGSVIWTVGRLEMGEAKNGKSAPYIFTKASEEEKQHALGVAQELGLTLFR